MPGDTIRFRDRRPANGIAIALPTTQQPQRSAYLDVGIFLESI